MKKFNFRAKFIPLSFLAPVPIIVGIMNNSILPIISIKYTIMIVYGVMWALSGIVSAVSLIDTGLYTDEYNNSYYRLKNENQLLKNNLEVAQSENKNLSQALLDKEDVNT